MSKFVEKVLVGDSFWSLASNGKLYFRTWVGDDIAVVYNELSGDTHLVGILGLEVLQLLTASTYTFKALTLRLSELYLEDALEEDTKLEDVLHATLFQLQDAGLLCETLI